MSKTKFQDVYQYAYVKNHITLVYKLHAKGQKK